MSDYYVLDANKRVVPAKDVREWGAMFGDINARRVGSNRIKIAGEEVHVSTVFIGIDHRFMSEGPPVVFETMIFGGNHDQNQWRCCTWNQAVEQHERAVELAFEKLLSRKPSGAIATPSDSQTGGGCDDGGPGR